MKHENEGRIVVVGAGIAGLSVANKLVEMGRPVTVVSPEVDPQAPLPTKKRDAIPTAVRPATMAALNLPTEFCPSPTRLEKGAYEVESCPIYEQGRVHALDELSARRTLLQQAAHSGVDLVEGKVVSLRTQELRGMKRVTGATLEDGQVVATGETGLVVVAAGRSRIPASGDIISQELLPMSRSVHVFGGHITSPSLREQPRDAIRSGLLHDAYGVITPMEQIEDEGTDYIAYFAVKGNTLARARGGDENVLKTMKELVQGSAWERLLDRADMDRVVFYSQSHGILRNSLADGLLMVGDAAAYLPPGGEVIKGIGRIERDTQLLAESIRIWEDLTRAGRAYNLVKDRQHRKVAVRYGSL